METNRENPIEPALNTEPVPVPDGAAAEPDLKAAKRAFSRLGLGTFVILIVTTLLQTLLSIVLNVAAADGWEMPSWMLWVLTFIPMYCVAVPCGILIFRGVPAAPAAPEPFGVGRFLKLLPICVFLMQAGNLIGVFVNSLLGKLKGGTVANPLESYALDDSSLWIKVLFLAVLAPLIEEFIFRRMLIDRMRPYGEKLAVVTSALMFGLFHGNFSQFFYAFALGVLFGYVYLRTGKLIYTAALHIVLNLFGSVVAPALLGNAEFDRLSQLEFSDVMSNPEALNAAITPGMLVFVVYSLLLFLLTLLGLVLLCISAGRMEWRAAAQELPEGTRMRTAWCNVGMILLVLGCLGMIATNILL